MSFGRIGEGSQADGYDCCNCVCNCHKSIPAYDACESSGCCPGGPSGPCCGTGTLVPNRPPCCLYRCVPMVYANTYGCNGFTVVGYVAAILLPLLPSDLWIRKYELNDRSHDENLSHDDGNHQQNILKSWAFWLCTVFRIIFFILWLVFVLHSCCWAHYNPKKNEKPQGYFVELIGKPVRVQIVNRNGIALEQPSSAGFKSYRDNKDI